MPERYLSVQDEKALASIAEATDVSGDPDAWADAYFSSETHEKDYIAWALHHLPRQRMILDASED